MILRKIFVLVAFSICMTLTSQAQTLLPDANKKEEQVKVHNKKQDYLRKVKADIELKQIRETEDNLPDTTRTITNPKTEKAKKNQIKKKATTKSTFKKAPLKIAPLKKEESN